MATLATEISLALTNRPGQLAAISEALGAAGVNVQSLSGVTAGRVGLLRLLFAQKDATRARRGLVKAGYRVGKSQVRKVLVVSVPDKPGGLARSATLLAKAKINVDTAYLAGRTKKRASVVLGVGKNAAKAKRAVS